MGLYYYSSTFIVWAWGYQLAPGGMDYGTEARYATTYTKIKKTR